ncbi:MAG: hypothetical protein KJS91_00685 [Planctomycetes bacterium]|nr:hypothetical protein [Planctomycetota bacterium]
MTTILPWAALSLERDPLELAQVISLPNVSNYLLTVGALCSLCVFLWLLRGGFGTVARLAGGSRLAVLSLLILALPMFLLDIASILALFRPLFLPADAVISADAPLVPRPAWANIPLAISGLASILLVAAPFVANLPRLSLRRILAIANLSFKEAIRKRVLYAFTGLLLIVLFGSWFIPSKPTDELRTYVSVVFYAMTVVLMLVGALLAASGLPADIRTQSLFLIVTKPVERVEILLGRLTGTMALMTLVLLALTGAGLLYIIRGVSPDAAEESLKAREPLFGILAFKNTTSEAKGDNVGREWEYRGYISGPTQGPSGLVTPQAAWTYATVPAHLGSRDKVQAEFTFDIYRTTKGFENRGVGIGLVITTRNHDPEELRKARERNPGLTPEQIATEHGYFQPAGSVTFFDYSTGSVEVPGGLFANAQKGDPQKPALTVTVTCKESTQYVGMARYDFYFRADDARAGAQPLRFAGNFLLASFALWLRLLLVISVTLVMSTELSTVISLLMGMVLMMLAHVQEFVRELVEGKSAGGGPLENIKRIIDNSVAAKPLEDTALNTLIQQSDKVVREVLGGLARFLPEVDRLAYYPEYVGNGFAIGGGDLAGNAIVTVFYILPWLLLGYHLLRWREVAGPT